ncbi:MAG: mechanosensitive ion channel family protein [Clostridia bacterium]|nr:mechanosensitive ion channel family protein [Clostridia bacterium]
MDTQQIQQMKSTTQRFIDTAIDWAKDFIPLLIGALIILIIGMWLSGVIAGIVSKALKKAKVGTEVVTFVNSFVRIALKAVVIVAALGTLGFNIASLVTALGAATVAIGLALQDTLKNVASGLMVLISKPFKVGDYVQLGALEGSVTKIDISSTHLLTIDNKEVIIPNSNITQNNITNYSSQEKRRVDLTYNVAYNSDIEKVKKVIRKAASGNDKVLPEPEIFIAVGKHGESSIEIIVRIWCKTPDYWSVYFYMQEKVIKEFKTEKIEIPYNKLNVINTLDTNEA